jgi:hypothetical protein
MQHHGLPTRLLDWSTTFAVALHFAMRRGAGDAAIWVLNPFELNKLTWGIESLPPPEELESSYYDCFISEEKVLEAKVVAIQPPRQTPRVLSQHAAFTLHNDVKTPLEKSYPSALQKILIPRSLRPQARQFLTLAGISEFSLFPDLDGLARDLLNEHFADARRLTNRKRPPRSSE